MLRVFLFLILPLFSQCTMREVYEWCFYNHKAMSFPVACYPKSSRPGNSGPVAPHAPTGLQALPGTSGIIELMWDDQPGCTFNVFSDSGSYYGATGIALSWNIGLPGQPVYNITLVAVDDVTGLESPPSSPPIEGISGS